MTRSTHSVETSAMVLSDSFDKLILAGTPLIDVRAPCEFDEAHIPISINLPLLNDEERALVGTCYKEKGQAAAIVLGNELVSEDLRAARLAQWQKVAEAHPSAAITCFRGGLRSQTAQQWLAEQGTSLPRIKGGYKALRQHLIDTTLRVASTKTLIIVAGKTGTGKTHLINRLPNSVDLEGLANHRGSAFGRRVSPQPRQTVFENALAIDLLHQAQAATSTLFLEDESRAIGSLSLPLPLHRLMSDAKIVSVNEPLEYRVETILNDYIVGNLHDYQAENPETAQEAFAASLLASLDRIKKRLGAERHAEVARLMHRALANNNEPELHRAWIHHLLTDYYDPMYDYQMSKKAQRVVYSGTSEKFLQWAADISASTR